ncbi:MAG: anhydro-N-acetylmuramic acid kinase [Bryobacteraceae bacterium]
MRVAGIMSGTSLDGIDVAIADISGRGWRTRFKLAGFYTRPYPKAVREAILAVSNTETHTAQIARLHFFLSELYAHAVEDACTAAGIAPQSIRLVGCHGQTIFHEGDAVPFLGRRVSSTLQIGDGSVLAERLGIPVVSDFRPRDIAAGGKGAPLVPYVDYLLFRHPRRGRVALNIGGIANLTAIPPGGAPESVSAFDTGPGNMVIDALVTAATKGRRTFDRGGRMAARGRVDQRLLDRLLSQRYYRRWPPKSAGREQYGSEFQRRFDHLCSEDGIATATQLTISTIALSIHRFVRPVMPVDDLIVSGGGAHNRSLMAGLAEALPGVKVAASSEFGIDVDAKEAIAFAILAYESWNRRPANLPSATGARRSAILGKLSP